ncbi:hypothetical protein JVT61DRAFT_3939 [Boletus reticuloceps]|uniref:Uncharacterized protein n=1 Tax=Boletus reticuloceps TaxID=495285 RepID=A0A8I2YL98_9AGAM|nr:hypothetical protein JVT61DRAFT_3939 [Boletus reticuloceps]
MAMFKWYQGSALVIVFLHGIRSTSQLGALVKSIWNTRAWTLQEYVAAKVVHFYTEYWTIYLNVLCSVWRFFFGFLVRKAQTTQYARLCFAEQHPPVWHHGSVLEEQMDSDVEREVMRGGIATSATSSTTATLATTSAQDMTWK